MKTVGSRKLADKIVEILDQKKAFNIKKVFIARKSVIASYMIIASGNSNTQVMALTNYVEEELSKNGINNQLIEPVRKEANRSSVWNVLDYGNVIVHIFTEGERKKVNFDELWISNNKTKNEKIKGLVLKRR